VINKQGDAFSIEGPYKLTCAAKKKYPDFPSHLPVQNYSTTITNYFSYCGWWKYWCRTAVACIPSDYITLQRCFW
jgi:hypothetical protein